MTTPGYVRRALVRLRDVIARPIDRAVTRFANDTDEETDR